MNVVGIVCVFVTRIMKVAQVSFRLSQVSAITSFPVPFDVLDIRATKEEPSLLDPLSYPCSGNGEECIKELKREER